MAKGTTGTAPKIANVENQDTTEVNTTLPENQAPTNGQPDKEPTDMEREVLEALKKAGIDIDADEDTTEEDTTEEVFVSDALTALYEKKKVLEVTLDKVGNTSKKATGIRLMLWEVGQSITNEINNLKKEKLRLEIEAKQKEIEANFWNLFTLYDNVKSEEAKLPPVTERNEEVMKGYNEANTIWHNACEPVLNRQLGNVPKVVAQGEKAQGNGTGGGKKTEEIRAIIAPLYASLSPAQIRAKVIKEYGFNDGTANAVIHQYEKENSLNGKKPD